MWHVKARAESQEQTGHWNYAWCLRWFMAVPVAYVCCLPATNITFPDMAALFQHIKKRGVSTCWKYIVRSESNGRVMWQSSRLIWRVVSMSVSTRIFRDVTGHVTSRPVLLRWLSVFYAVRQERSEWSSRISDIQCSVSLWRGDDREWTFAVCNSAVSRVSFADQYHDEKLFYFFVTFSLCSSNVLVSISQPSQY